MTLFDSLTGTTAQGRLDYIERYIGYYVDQLLNDAQPDSFETWLLRKKLCHKGIYCVTTEFPRKAMVLNFLGECEKSSKQIIISGTTRACKELHNIVFGDGFYSMEGYFYKWIVIDTDESLRDSTPIYNSMGAIISDFRWIVSDDTGYLGMMEFCQNQYSVRKYIKKLNELGIAVIEQR